MMGSVSTTDNDARLRELRLLGPEGDPEAQALWLALSPAYTAAFELLGMGSIFGLDDCSKLERDLRTAAEGTPLAGTRCLISRATFIDEAIERMSKGNSLVTSIVIDGVQHDSPIMKTAIQEYRRHVYGCAMVDLSNARTVMLRLRDLLLGSTPAHFRYIPRGPLAGATLSTIAEIRIRLHEHLLAVEDPFVAFAKKVKRMNTMERLGRNLT